MNKTQEAIEREVDLVGEGKLCDHVGFGLCHDCTRGMLTRIARLAATEAIRVYLQMPIGSNKIMKTAAVAAVLGEPNE